MVINPGLAATAAAITRNQARFDAQAQNVVAATEDLAGADPTPGAAAVDAPAASDLAGSAVALQADAFVNRVLFATYRKQQEQQASLVDLVKPG